MSDTLPSVVLNFIPILTPDLNVIQFFLHDILVLLHLGNVTQLCINNKFNEIFVSGFFLREQFIGQCLKNVIALCNDTFASCQVPNYCKL